MFAHNDRPAAKRPRALVCLCLQFALAVTCLWFDQVLAASPDLTRKITFHIEAQPLDTALLEFSQQAGFAVSVPGRSLHRIQTLPLSGTLSAGEALTELLDKSGWGYQAVAGTISIVPRMSEQHSGSTAESSTPIRLSDSATQTSRTDDDDGGPLDSGNRGSPSQSAPKLQEVVVTGTNIRGDSQPVGAPLRTITSDEIAQSGYATTDQLIQSLPETFRGGSAGASPDTNFQAGANKGYNSSYGSGVNLRGLGNTATLVLVNGHRVASSASGFFTDISSIPLAAIDHIDVLTDGASAIYGSDAIAGVVNIILKNNQQGVETGIRYGAAQGNIPSYGADISLGKQWADGGIGLTADFSRQDALDSSDRSYTSGVKSPTSVIPQYKMATVAANGHQALTEQLDAHADVQYASKTIDAFYSPSSSYEDFPGLTRWSASGGLTYRLSDRFEAALDSSAGQETNSLEIYKWSGGLPTSFYSYTRTISRFAEQRLSITGNLFDLPAGTVKAALGGSYRTENFAEQDRSPTTIPSIEGVGRHVGSVYSEVRIPVVSSANALPGIEELTVSAAGRFDRYSDFGGTWNPKVGLSWSPIASVQIRGAYSTSFRAPATGTELLQSDQGITVALIDAFPGPGPHSASVPVLYVLGGEPNLQPETATNITAGIDWKPADGLVLSLNYYRITYSQQLAAAPYSVNPLNDAALSSVITRYPDSAPVGSLYNSILAAGKGVYDLTGGVFGADPISLTQYVYDDRTRNLSSTDTNGIDASIRYHVSLPGAGALDTQLNATRVNRFDIHLTETAPAISEVNTVGYPARLRLRDSTTWASHQFSLTVAANYIGSYPDTSSPSPRTVGSYLTFDAVARVFIGGDSVVSLSASNLTNRQPPYVYSGTANIHGSNYDPANAGPLGRFWLVELTHRWQ